MLNLRESCIRENCTCSLGGGRRLARKRASSDPTPTKPSNVGGGKGPQLKTDARSNEGQGIDDESSRPRAVFRSCGQRHMLHAPSYGVCVFSESRMREICQSGCASRKKG